MKKILLAVSLLMLASFVVADHRPVEDTLEVETTVTDDDYRYYADAGKVAFPAIITRERVNGTLKEKPIYENTSISRWTAMQGNDAGTQRIGEIIEEELGSTDNLTIAITDHETHEYTIEITYNTNRDYSYTYEELQNTVPDDVEATVNYEGHTNTAVMPVETQESDVEMELQGDAAAYSDNRTEQEKDSEEKETHQDTLNGIPELITAILNMLPI